MHHFGAYRDRIDDRDIPYQPEVSADQLPPAVTVRSLCTRVYNQMPMWACTSNAIAALFDAVASKTNQQLFEPSRLFIYYNERGLEGTTDSDKGAQLRSGLKAVARFGVCEERLWPYEAANVSVKPSDDAFAAAARTRVYEYRRISHNIDDMRGCLAAGYPFVAGLELHESAMASQQTGSVPMPTVSDRVMGGHAALCVAYDNAASTFTFLNSMGPAWGTGGCFTVPFQYLATPKLTYDMWTFRGIACGQ